MRLDGVGEQRAHFFDQFAFVSNFFLFIGAQFPIGFGLGATVLKLQNVSWQDGIDVLDDRQRLLYPSPRQITVQGGRRNFTPCQPRGEQRADLRREDERFAVLVIVEGLDPEAIANQRERSPPGVPEAEREHPPPIRNRVTASRAKALQQDLGVALGPKSQTARDKLPANVAKIEDLAAVGDPIACRLVAHRLMSGRRKVEDGQAAMREGHGQSVPPVADEFDAAVVRPAMSQGVERAVNWLNQLGPRSCCDNPEDSAHKYKVVMGI